MRVTTCLIRFPLSRALPTGLFALVWAVLGCSPSLRVAADTQISCGNDADCPDDWRCNRSRGLCEPVSANLPPELSLTVTAPARPLANVAFDVMLRDANGTPNGTDHATIQVEFSRDAATWCRPQALVGGLDAVPTQAVAQRLNFQWNALADAQCLADPECAPTLACTGSPLPVVLVDGDADGIADTEQLGWIETLYVRALAVDNGTPARSSAWVVSAPFAAGNEPPDAVLELAPGPYRGVMPIPFVLLDDAQDLASVQFEYHLPGEAATVWHAATISEGATTGVATSPVGDREPAIVLWDTVEASGIGRLNLNGVGIRMRALDEPAPGHVQAGAWSAEVTIDIRNQAAPLAVGLSVLNGFQSTEVTGALLLAYSLVDEEEDRVDVQVEYSTDSGVQWLPCTEFPAGMSEGRYDLSTGRIALNGEGGTRHLFAWDVIADLGAVQKRVQVRVTPADDGGRGTASLYGVGPLVGFAGSFADSWMFAKQTPTATTALDSMRFGDFDGDGIRDLAFGTPAGFTVRYGVAGGSFGANLTHTFGSSTMPGVGLAVADINGDGADDVVARGTSAGDPGVLQAFLGQIGSKVALAKVGPTFGSPHVVGMLALGDLNGDEAIDLVSVDWNQQIRVFAGNGDGTFAAAASLVSDSVLPQTAALVIADVDGNGVQDLVRVALKHQVDPSYLFRTQAHLLVYLADATASATTFALRPAQVALDDLYVTDNGDANVAMGTNPFSGIYLQALDINRDGQADVALAHTGTSNAELVVCTGGDGGLAACARTHVPGKPAALAVADRGVGVAPDLVVRSTNSTEDRTQFYRWFLQGSAVPSLATLVDAASPSSDALKRLLAADLNGDHLSDLVGFSGSESAVFIANADGQVAAPAMASGAFLSFADRARALSVSDNDFDGRPDLLLVSGGSGGTWPYASWISGATTQGVASRPLLATAIADLSRAATPGTDETFTIADINHDARLDVVVYDPDATFVSVLPGTVHAAALGFAASVLPSSLGAGEFLVGVGDTNDDGFDDLLVASPTGNRVWPAQVSGGVWSQDFDTSTTAVAGTAQQVALAADLDRDGFTDVCGWSSGLLTVYFGDGAGNLAATCNVSISGGQATWNARVADLDADPRLEIVVAVGTAATGSHLRVFKATATRCTYTEVAQDAGATLGAVVRDMLTMDMDGDGLLDIVTTTSPTTPANAPSAIYVWRGLATNGIANGKFAAPVAVSGLWQGSLVAADMNSDGLLDLVGAGDGSTGIPKGVALWQGRRGTPWQSWSTPLNYVTDGLGWILREAPTGAESADQPRDRFGVARHYRLARHRYTGAEPKVGSDGLALRPYESLRRAMGWTPADAYQPLSDAWAVEGPSIYREVDVALLPGSAGSGMRLQAAPRFVPNGDGMGPDLEAGRSLEFTLPILEALRKADLSGRELRLFVRHDDYLRAAAWPGDPLETDPAAPDLLACAEVEPSNGTCLRPMFRPISEWQELTFDRDHDLSTGVGARFTIETLEGVQQLRIRTDRLGVMLAVYR